MPYEPSFPASHADLTSDDFRAQFQGLKALIDAVSGVTTAQVDGVSTLNPGDAATVLLSVSGITLHLSFGIPRGIDGSQGVPGGDGAQGPAFAQAIVEAVNTLNPGDPASVGVNFDGSNVRFTFGLPRGQDGLSSPPVTSFLVDGVSTLNPGDNATVQSSFDGTSVRLLFGIPRGSNGNDGGTGPQGLQGPPFASAIVDSVTSLNPGDTPTVSTSFDGSNVRFTFGIPRGFNGNDGGQGPPGEVSQSQLSSAIAGTSNNTNSINTLDSPFANDPPTLADLETMRAKLNEMILNGRR